MSITASEQESARRIIETLPDRLAVGPPVTHKGLTVFPIDSTRPAAGVRYQTLDQALKAGTLRITEVSHGGSVPQLRLTNDGSTHVLLLDGEELVGAKQNRALNVTVLAPAGKTITIPVACVEQGRWSPGAGRDFGSADSLVYAKLRMSSSRDVLHSTKSGRGYVADQSRVWSGIEEKSRRVGSTSGTRAMRGMYEARGTEIDGYVQAFEPGENQIGAAFCVGDRVSGVELFDRVGTLAALLPKLVRSYAMDAIEVQDRDGAAPDRAAVQAFIGDVGRANKEVRAGVGLGEDVRLSAPRLVGGALVFEEAVLHLSAFTLLTDDCPTRPAGTPPEREAPRSRLSRLWRRRQQRS